MNQPQSVQSQELTELTSEWERLFLPCLQECAAGRWGLFVASPVVAAHADWPEAERLRSLARRIKQMYAASGSVHSECERFLRYCSLGQNVRTEPKLAAALLEELRQHNAPA
jgi:hypothetical protein